METLNTLISRHSVRTYTGESLSASDLEKILKAADCTPVCMGLYDQIHLTVVNNRDFIANADTATAAIMHTEGTHPTYNVLALIFISAPKQDPMFTEMMISSAAMIAHNMVLEATVLVTSHSLPLMHRPFFMSLHTLKLHLPIFQNTLQCHTAADMSFF